ncbi:unnamed protein product [Mytilus edulis]|uniref:Uncharacterized protein n=1 Tax=Mytilus edulis TaxID=6550 RepID=A0A8S3S8I0_MYTED|nr:unnamed protein product [Mytilus edulis]
MAYQTATHISKDKSVMAYQTAKQESNGKSDSYLTQIKRQDIGDISDSYPTTHYKTKRAETTTKSDRTQIKDKSSDGISDSYHHTLQNKRVMAKSDKLPNTDQRTSRNSAPHYKTRSYTRKVMANQTATLTQIKRQVSDGITATNHTTKQRNGKIRQLPNKIQEQVSGHIRRLPPHTTKQESNGISDQKTKTSQQLPPHYKTRKCAIRQLPKRSKDKSNIRQLPTTHYKTKIISDSYLTHIKRQDNGISDSYTKSTHIKRQVSGIQNKRVRQLPEIKATVMAYQNTTHYKTNYPPHTTKQGSIGKSDSHLTPDQRQVSDGISDGYHHTTKQEWQIRQLPNTDQKDTSRVITISDSYHHTLQNKRVITNQTAA